MKFRIVKLCLVAGFAYYAGSKGITLGNIADWIEKSNITGTLKNTLSKTLELVEEKQVKEKTGILIDELKEKISD